jgi:phosphoribosylformimino-5-aminoimidazole carboxamide ribotide isomerase
VKIMQVIPAIDVRGGYCVRLRQGDFDQETIFGDDPAAMAARWESEGAGRIHLVDLDGAKAGRPVNVEAVRRVVARVGVPCQLGGGIRDEATIAAWLEAGLERLVVGTQALRDPDWFGLMARSYPGRLLLGLDARDGQVAAQGWLEVSSTAALALAREFDPLPLAGIIYTDIARDGTLEGPNLGAIAALARAVRTPVFASGGVGKLEDLERLAALPIAGCIVGRALYEGRFTIREAVRLLGGPGGATAAPTGGDRPPVPPGSTPAAD